MSLPAFELHRPTSVAEASQILAGLGDEAAPYWGGTELLLLLKLGLARYSHLVDLKRVAGLAGLREEPAGLVLGAGLTHREIERCPSVLKRLPQLADMERQVANVRVRSVGTLGGNLCLADPHSDPLTFLLALDAVALIAAAGWSRELPLEAFLVGPYQTALEPGEVLTGVRVPVPGPATQIAHARLAFHERPVVTVTCMAHLEKGRIVEARLAIGSAGPRPVRARPAEAVLTGLPATPPLAAIRRAGELSAEAAQPVDDAEGAADYKRELVRVLVHRALRQALPGAGEDVQQRRNEET